MVMREDTVLLAQLRIEAANNPATVQTEVKPLVPLRAFQTSEHLLVEASGLREVQERSSVPTMDNAPLESAEESARRVC